MSMYDWTTLPGVWDSCECVQDESNDWWRCPVHGGPGERGWPHGPAVDNSQWHWNGERWVGPQEALADSPVFIPVWLNPATPSVEDAAVENARLVAALAAHEQVLEALLFYADPENYHALAVFADRPSGAFADDYDDEHGHPDYDRPMYGTRARAALKAWGEATKSPHFHDYYCGSDCTEGSQ